MVVPFNDGQRFDANQRNSARSSLQEVMEWAYDKYGDEVYTEVKAHKEVIEAHVEREEITLSA